MDGTPTVGKQLTEQQKTQLQSILAEFEDVLQPKPGQTTLAEHHIQTDNAKPVKLPPYRLPHAYHEQLHKELDEMFDFGIIEKSMSEWVSPIVLVKKKDKSL